MRFSAVSVLSFAFAAVSFFAAAGVWAASEDEDTPAASVGPKVWLVNTAEDPESWAADDEVVSMREAIGRAQSGDRINFVDAMGGKEITLNGSELEIRKGMTIDAVSGNVTINAKRQSRVFLIDVGRENSVELINLDITGGGDVENGGGICKISGDLTIRNVMVSDNSSSGNGGGIFNLDGSLTVVGSKIAGNFSIDPNAPESDDAFTADGNGGGIFCEAGDVTVIDSDVSENEATCLGGGINCGGQFGSDDRSYSLEILGSTVSENSAKGPNGGGIFIGPVGRLDIENSTISGNRVKLTGAGICGAFSESVKMTITNSTVSGNSAGDSCGGIQNQGGELTIVNSVIAGNSGNNAQYGYVGGIESYGKLTVLNSTITGNSAMAENESVGGISCDGKFKLTNSIVALNYAANPVDDVDVVGRYSGSHNIVGTDPGFVAGPVFQSGKLVNAESLDLSLAAGSAAIDAGTNDFVKTETDRAGRPRIVGAHGGAAAVDIGAYEYQENAEGSEPEVVAADFIQTKSIDSRESGTTWNVVTTLLDSVDAEDGEVSLREAIENVRAGETITFDESLSGGTIRLSGVQLDISKGITIDAASIGGITIDAGGKSRVFRTACKSVRYSVELIGLTITGGKAVDKSGGGISNLGVIQITDCLIYGNSAVGQISGGGGIMNIGGTMTVTNSTVTKNYAGRTGSGICNSDHAKLKLINTVVKDNIGGVNGGGIGNINSSSLKIVNSTIAGNASTGLGGGVYNNKSATQTVENSIVALNQSKTGSDIYIVSSYPRKNNIIGSDPGFVTAPKFEEVVGEDRNVENWRLVNADELDLSLAPESPAIDAGTNDAVETETDIAGNDRIINGIVDIGAYEYPNP